VQYDEHHTMCLTTKGEVFTFGTNRRTLRNRLVENIGKKTKQTC